MQVNVVSSSILGHKGRQFHGAFIGREQEKTEGIGKNSSIKLATACEDGSVRIWENGGKKLTNTIEAAHSEEALRVCWYPQYDSDLLLSGGGDGIVQFWNASDGSNRGSAEMGHLEQIYSIHASNHGNVTVGFNDLVCISSIQDPSHPFFIHEFKSLKQNDQVYGGERNPDQVCFVFDVANHPSMEDQILASALSDGDIHVFDTRIAGHIVSVLRNDNCSCSNVTFSDDGLFLVSSYSNGMVVRWDVRQWAPVNILHGHDSMCFGSYFWPGRNDTVVSNCSKGILGVTRVMEQSTNQNISKAWEKDRYPIHSVALYPISSSRCIFAALGGTFSPLGLCPFFTGEISLTNNNTTEEETDSSSSLVIATAS